MEVAQTGQEGAILPDSIMLIPGDSPDRAAALIPGYLP